MNERHEDDRMSMARVHLDNLFDELYLTGDPKGLEYYHVRAIALASRRYLQAIGVQKFPSQGYVDDDIEKYVEAHMDPTLQPAELAGDTDNTSHVLGVVIGTAYYHPDSRLTVSQKQILLTQSIDALKRVELIEPGHPRSDAVLFAWMFATCARDYYPASDSVQIKSQILDRFQDAPQPPQPSKWRRWGRKTLEALADYPGPTSIPPHLKDDGRE